MKTINNIIFFMIMLHMSVFSQQITITISPGNWSNPSNWDNGLPTNQDTAIINHGIFVDQKVKVGDLIINDTLVNNGFKIVIESNWINNGIYIDTISRVEFKKNQLHNLIGNTYFYDLSIKTADTVNVLDSIWVRNVLKLDKGYLDVSGGMLTLMSDSIYTGRVGKSKTGTILGEFIFEKWIDRCNRWSIYGGPFDATLNDYASNAPGKMIYTGFPNSDFPTFPWVNSYLWNEDYISGGWVIPDGNNVIPRGVGFWYWNSDTVYNSNSPGIPQRWKVVIKGSINFNNTFFFPVQYTNNGNISNDGWNLISNPYPGTIDWDKNDWNRVNIDNAVYEFNTCSQTYSSYVGGIGVNGGNKLIGAFQGFYVKANGPSPILSSGERVLKNNNELLKNGNVVDNILRIRFNEDEIVVRVDQFSDDNFNDELDAHKFITDSSKIYSEVYSHTLKYSINSVNDSTSSIPIYTLGSGTLYFSEVGSWDSNYDLYLEDLSNGSMVSISSISSLTFTESNINYVNRFVIHFHFPSALAVAENNENGIRVIYSDSEDDIIIKSNYQDKIVNINLYDLLGQVIFTDQVVITSEGYRMKRPNGISIMRIFNCEIDKSVKIF